MKESRLKNSVSFFIIGFHFGIILLTICLWAIGGFLFEEMTTTVALIIPMFSIYTTAVIKHIIATKSINNIKNKNISSAYVFLTFFILSFYVISLISMIFLKSFNIAFSNFEQFKVMLGVIQTAFGAYVGLILSSMFEIEIENTNNSLNEEQSKPRGFFGKIKGMLNRRND